MFSLRYYQKEAVGAIRSRLSTHASTACVMPTGTGKSECYLSLAVEEPGRVMVLVHRDYLISSPVARLARVGFRDVAVEKAAQRAEAGGRRAQVVFASVLSVGPESQAARLASFDPMDFSLLIIDEAHRAVGESYRRVIAHMRRNPRLRVLLLTATPKRKDGVGLHNVCESVAYEMTPGRAAAEGWICRPRFFKRDVPSLDFSRVRLKGNDLDQDKIAELLMEEEPLHKVCASLNDDTGPTIVFCPKVAVAMAYAGVMHNRYRFNRAVCIHQGSTDGECERATKGLEDGSIDFVFNVDKLTEGYDVPRVVRVAWAAPTASLVRWTQGCGRGFRPDASIASQLTGGVEDAEARRLLISQSAKPWCDVVTYYPSNCRHQICSAVDLLGGHGIDAGLREAAEQVQEETSRLACGGDTEEDIETARAFLDLRAALDARRREIKAKADVRDEEYDGLGGAGKRLKDARPTRDAAEAALVARESWGDGKPASEPQRGWLRWKGVAPDVVAGMTAWRARVVRDLFEMGVPLARALGYGKRQALKVRDEMQAKKGGAA